MHTIGMKSSALLVVSLAVFYVSATPILVHRNIDAGPRAMKSYNSTGLNEIFNTLRTLLYDVIEGNVQNVETIDQILGALLQSVSYIAPPPVSIPQIIDIVAKSSGAKTNSTPPNIIDYAMDLLVEGINPKNIPDSLGALTTSNSMANQNPPLPNVIKDGDPTFSVAESILRAAMYFPEGFNTLNASGIPAIVMIPPTAIPGGQTWAVSYAKPLARDQIANPMWLNIPSNSLQDAQVTAEYVAYAINYVSEYTGGRNLSVIAWSQGTVNTQWALKYFPSTQQVVTDYIGISPDYRGTVLAQVMCPGFPRLPCPPSVLQQIANSTFINVLRRNGGDSELVPTTTVYSATDEVVQPQSGPDASGFLFNANNNLVQELCPLLPAGLIYTHEGVLYNPLGYALTVDALTHAGHADTSRMLANNPGICLLLSTPGLTVTDVLSIEATVVTSVLNIATYFPKQFEEPPTKAYATY